MESLQSYKSARAKHQKRMPFLKQENSPTPIQLRFKELCGGFYPYTSVSEQETKVVSCAGVTFSSTAE